MFVADKDNGNLSDMAEVAAVEELVRDWWHGVVDILLVLFGLRVSLRAFSKEEITWRYAERHSFLQKEEH